MRNYDIGAVGKVRSWNSMANEFGEKLRLGTKVIDINRSMTFIGDMEPFCGEKIKVSSNKWDGIFFVEGEIWAFSPEVIVGDWHN